MNQRNRRVSGSIAGQVTAVSPPRIAHGFLTAVGETVIQRVTYSIAGQVTAVRVTNDPEAANNGLFYIHSDHLGSTSVLTKYSDGYIVNNSLTRYVPFGGYRSGGPSRITDRAFTGQKENMALGLYYYNARYYVPGIVRFLSADTIVPDPERPQSYNRYSYVRNNPVGFIDPSGHDECGIAGTVCIDDPLSPLKIISEWDEAGIIGDPARTKSLQIPLIISDEKVGEVYIMPVGVEQAGNTNKAFKWMGRRLAELGIASDAIELILASAPDPGAGAALGGVDATITYFSGLLEGYNYGLGQHPNLPPMVAINQDLAVNVTEAVVGGGAPYLFGAMGLIATSEAGPGGMTLGGGAGFYVGKMVDAVTSYASAVYDLGRYNDSIHNYGTVGVSNGELIVVYWPKK